MTWGNGDATMEDEERISRIQTRWTALLQAHQGGDGAHEAQAALLLRYHGAAYRYLLALLRDPAQAEELTQEFAVRFLRGDFRNASPEKGRFRDFLKAALRNLARKHWRDDPRQRERAPEGLPEPAVEEAEDAGFVRAWGEELFARAWQALRRQEEETGGAGYALLRLKTDQPELRSAELAALLSERLGRPFSEESARQAVKRARDRFQDLLLEEVARSLPGDDPEALEQELAELQLLAYCGPALKRRQGG
jgi:RNA polymerase sigma-70 factor (ECF subfamily)